MTFKLSKSIQAGQKIKLQQGWRKVLSVTSDGVTVKEGLVKFGDTVLGWKSK